MKSRTLLPLAICWFLPFLEGPASFAQPSQGAAMLGQMAKQLNLSPQQKVRLLPILQAEAPQVRAIKNDPSLTGMQKLRQLGALHAQNDPQVRAILSPQQYQRLQEMRHKEIEEMLSKRMNH